MGKYKTNYIHEDYIEWIDDHDILSRQFKDAAKRQVRNIAEKAFAMGKLENLKDNQKFNNLTIPNRIKNIISMELDVNISDIYMTSLIVDDLGADSLDLVELIIFIEEEYNIEIPDADAENIKTVNDLVTYLTVKGCDL